MADQSSQLSQTAQQETEMLDVWKKENTFEASVENRKDAALFSFYDGPPFANGLPHYGHVVPVTIKDAVTRYKTMRGYYVPRCNGWDTHGLPVEYEIEKELGVSGKKQIEEEIGVEKFNQLSRDSVFKYKGEWEAFFERLGRWSDKDDAYATLDDDFMESVWWVVKQLHEKDLLYRGFRSMPYCPRCATPLSNFEVNQGYQDDVEDPSLYVLFKLSDEDAYLLGWTTTPWSIPGNTAIAVDPTATYVKVELKTGETAGKIVILAKDRLELFDEKYDVQDEFLGEALVGKSYEPLFAVDDEGVSSSNVYKVWAADFVSTSDGSGVLHVAPAFGEDDLKLGLDNDIPVLSTIDQHGHVTENIGVPHVEGRFFKGADKHIIEHLTQQGSVYLATTLKHTYPFCWRCDTPLLYYATPSWFVAVSKIREQLVKTNGEVNWVPSHLKDGRFGNWLKDARDWGISRNRFWGNPLPIWQTEDGEETIVVGSIEELKNLAEDPSKVTDLHRPAIDDVIIKTASGKTARRVPEVLDCWFESGSMPYGQRHYPFEDKYTFSQAFPADFIAEGLDQTRGWFYTLHVLGAALFGQPAFKNVITNGLVMAADGKKLSKRLRNYPPLEEVFDSYGADVLRFFMLSSPAVAGENVRFGKDALADVQRNLFATLQNSYRFFDMYAKIDGWKPASELKQPEVTHLLDRWMLARLELAIHQVTTGAEAYRLDKATRPLRDLLDDLSNWYVRRSRRRFWKSGDDADKQAAYATLHYTLVRTCQLLAPWAPFLSDKLYRELSRGTSYEGSVHLSDWPSEGAGDENLLAQMQEARTAIAEGLRQRAEAGIKVRQPLAKVDITTTRPLGEGFKEICEEELNVQAANLSSGAEDKVVLDTEITERLKLEGLARDFIRQVQETRKRLGFEVDDRIERRVHVHSDEHPLNKALKLFERMISSETLSEEVAKMKPSVEARRVRIEGVDVDIFVQKAS